MPSLRGPLALLSTIVVAAGCGAEGGGDAPRDDPVVRPGPTALLTIRVDDGEGETTSATVRCAPGAGRATGYLRLEQTSDLCRRIRALSGFLTSRPPRDRVCAQVYGGPATARISGRIEGERVDRRLARTDACEIDEWNRVEALLPEVE